MGHKSDTLEKHAGKCTATIDMPPLAVKKDETYIFNDYRYLKAVATYCAKNLHAPTKLNKNGRPMLEYKSPKELFMFSKMPNLSKKHWDDNSGWLIAEYLHKQVMVKSREVLSAAKYLAITCDEVTTVDNQNWISIHTYCMQDFYK